MVTSHPLEARENYQPDGGHQWLNHQKPRKEGYFKGARPGTNNAITGLTLRQNLEEAGIITGEKSNQIHKYFF